MARKRKPFIAVEFEAIDAIVAAASAAKKSEAELGWGLVRLWRWCWQQRTAEVDRLVIEGWLPGCLPVLVAFGFVRDDGGALVTVRGLDRYITVALAQADAAHATNAKRLAAQNDPTPSPPKKKAKPTQVELPGVEAPPKPPREPSLQEQMYAHFLATRLEALARDESEPVPDEEHPPAFVNASLGAILRECAGIGLDAEATIDRFGLLVDRYLADSYYATRTPPFPFRMLVTEKTRDNSPAGWRRIWAQVEDEARADE